MSIPMGQASAGSSLGLFVLASLAVIGLTAVVSRYLASWQRIQTRGRRVRILEGVPIGRDRQLLLVAIGKEVILLGASAGGVSLVHKVDDPAEVAALQEERPILDPVQAREHGALEESIRTSLTRMRSLLTSTRDGSDA